MGNNDRDVELRIDGSPWFAQAHCRNSELKCEMIGQYTFRVTFTADYDIRVLRTSPEARPPIHHSLPTCDKG